MTSDTRMTMHRGAAALVAVALLAAGAGATYLLMRGDAGTGGHAAGVAAPAGAQCVSSRARPRATAVT